MKSITFIFIALLLSYQPELLSQSCLPEGITFTTQAEIDNFQTNYPDCNEIEGNVTIGGYPPNTDITNLNGLNVLTSVGENLRIILNESLTSLSGLDNVTSIGGAIWIGSNNTLINMSGMEGLQTIENGLYLGYNTSLTSLTGLENVTDINGEFGIHGNSTLSSLIGLASLTSIGELRIYNNEILSSLLGLENVTSINGGLAIGGNSALMSLTGLDNVTTIGNSGIRLEFNESLTSLTGLDNISSGSITSLFIIYNEVLSACEVQSVCDYLVAPPNSAILIHDNASGCNSPEEVIEACDGICLPYGITFSTQEEIDSFQTNHPDCSEILGDVTISGEDIINLNGLDVVTSIRGNNNLYGMHQACPTEYILFR